MFEYTQNSPTKEYEEGYKRIKNMGCKVKARPHKMKGSKKTKKK